MLSRLVDVLTGGTDGHSVFEAVVAHSSYLLIEPIMAIQVSAKSRRPLLEEKFFGDHSGAAT